MDADFHRGPTARSGLFGYTSSAGDVETTMLFDWPPIDDVRPRWTGREFVLGDRGYPVLDYGAKTSGWSEHLTLFHEEVAGEGVHPIDVASRRRARRALRRYVRTRPEDATLLEVGCSSGFLVRELTKDWPRSLVIGSDYLAEPLYRLAAEPGPIPLLRFDLVECPLPDESLDAVVLLNVLEHIDDHGSALAQVARILKPGGIAVVEVPAGPHLYDAYDEYLRHFRRYRLDDLCALVETAGLQILERSHLGFLLYPAFASVKRRNRRERHTSEHSQRDHVKQSITNSAATPVLGWTLALEEKLSQFLSYPIGIRCVVTAVKRDHGN
jgi:SAM-dependent methyltransferase